MSGPLSTDYLMELIGMPAGTGYSQEMVRTMARELIEHRRGFDKKALAELDAAVTRAGTNQDGWAIKMIADMLRELGEWRSGERAMDNEKGQAKAWEAVFEVIHHYNPSAFTAKWGEPNKSGAAYAKAELERLYKLERDLSSLRSSLTTIGWIPPQS